MKQLLDIIKNSLIGEFEIDVDKDELTDKLINLSNDPVKRDVAIKLMAAKLQSKLQYEELLTFISQQKIRWQFEDWIFSMLKSEKVALISELPNMLHTDLESVVSVSQSEPTPSSNPSDSSANEATEKLPINENVKMYLDGRLRFTDLQRGFEVELINGSTSDVILRKTDTNYAALSARLLDKDYLLQIAEIMVKNSSVNSAYTIHVPTSLVSRTKEEQIQYVSMMKDALIRAGAPKDAINLPFEIKPKVQNSERRDGEPISKEERAFIDQYTGSNIKNRFFQYLDRDKKSPSKNPWINFETLCISEGARVVKGMLEDGYAWAPNANLSDKVFAINKYIDATFAKNPDEYFGVVAIESDDGGISFKPDIKPFAMEHVYGIEATPKQLNIIKKLGFTDDTIDSLVEKIDAMVDAQKQTAQASFREEYDKEAATHQPDYQPDYQPEYQPDYQPEYQPDYQPEYQPDYQPEYQDSSSGYENGDNNHGAAHTEPDPSVSATPKDEPNNFPPQPSPKVGF